MESTAIRKERNWTEEESLALVALVKESERVIEGKFSASVTTERKRNAWKGITDTLNTNFTNQVRHWESVKKRYANIKQTAKRKNTISKHPPTGNEGSAPIFTLEEDEYLRQHEGAPSIDGIVGGAESSATATASVNLNVSEDIQCLLQMVSEPRDSTYVNLPIPESSGKKRKHKEDKLFDLDVEVQELTIKKLKLEIELLQLQKNKILNES